MTSVKLATLTSSISCLSKKCVLEETNRHSNKAIKVVGDANETIGHGLSEEEIKLSVDAEIDGDPRDAAERKWTLGGGIKVPCIYRFYGPKKSIAEF